MNSNLPAFANYVRQSRQNEAFNEWFSREAKKGLANIPVFQPQPPPSMGPGPNPKKS